MPLSLLSEMTQAIFDDCMQGMKQFPNQHFDWAVCDPPYGINAGNMGFVKNTKNYVVQNSGKSIKISTRKKYEVSNFDTEAPQQEYFDEVRRVSKNQIIFGINYFTHWKGVGEGRIVWDKGVPDGLGFRRYEYAYCSAIDYTIQLPLLHSGMQQAVSLDKPMQPKGDKRRNEPKIHPTQKPKLLYKWIYLHFVQPGQSVLDTHLGSGNSRIVAHKMGFDFLGYEIDPVFIEKHHEYFTKEVEMPLFT